MNDTRIIIDNFPKWLQFKSLIFLFLILIIFLMGIFFIKFPRTVVFPVLITPKNYFASSIDYNFHIYGYSSDPEIIKVNKGKMATLNLNDQYLNKIINGKVDEIIKLKKTAFIHIESQYTSMKILIFY